VTAVNVKPALLAMIERAVESSNNIAYDAKKTDLNYQLAVTTTTLEHVRDVIRAEIEADKEELERRKAEVERFAAKTKVVDPFAASDRDML
jgi:hypothetical protein